MLKIDQPKLSDLPALSAGESYCIVGAPATGKTSTLLKLVAEFEDSYRPEEILVLAASRRQASKLRDHVALNSRKASSLPRAESVSAFAFARLQENQSKVKLLSGPAQERLIRSLVLEKSAEFKSLGFNPKSIQLGAFIQELRDLLQVVLDFRLTASELLRLQQEHGELKLGALLAIFDDYQRALDQGGWVDNSTLLTRALNLESSHRVVLVDDAQELSTAALDLVARQLEGRPGIIFGDPDAATQGFRGAEPGSFLRLSQHRIYLTDKPKSAEAILGTLSKIATRIPVAAAGPQREVLGHGEVVESSLFESTSAEADHVSTWLRKLRLEQEVPFAEMAVVVRTQAQIEQLSKDLVLRGVPIRLSTPAEPIAKNQLGRAILDIAAMVYGEVTRELVVDILQSSLFSLTSIQIRRLERQIVHQFGMRVDAAWQQCFELGAEVDSFEARALNRLLEAVRGMRIQPPKCAHELVSRIFELAPSSLATLSRSRSSVAQAVNRDLDATLRLFAAAIRFDSQEASEVIDFVNQQLDQRVAEDAIYAEQLLDAVLVTTPSSLAGQRFRYLALPRLQDGIWPNLKLRSSLLGATALRSYLAGRSNSPTQEVRGELADELRLFYKSIGAASEGILLSAMQGEEEQPSQFFTLIGSEPRLSELQIDFDLRRYVGRLRYSLSQGDENAAGLLALLALADVPGAHPQSWQGLLASSTAEPIFRSDEQVLLSASSLDAFEKCPLHWFIQTFAVGKQSFQASIGTLLHKALELAKEPADIQTYVESNWHELEFELGWQERAQRQRAMEMSALLAQYLKEAGAAHTAEEGFELEVGRLRIRGKIDRVEKSDSGLVIADLKTGKTLPDAASSKQLAIYQLAMIRKVGAENVSGAKLISIGTGKLKILQQEKLQQEHLAALDNAFESFEKSTSASDISAKFSTHCEADQDCSLLIREAVTNA